MIGGEKLNREREKEIFDILDKLKQELGLDYIYQSTIELEGNKNLFLAKEPEFKNILEKTLGVKFEGNLAIRDGLIMRKQIGPLMKEYLEKNL
jgi:hypothetical protein